MNVPTSWNAFRLLLNMRGRAACDINAYVELEDTVDDDGEELDDRILAGNVVRLILEETGFRFNSHTTKPLKHGASFNFFCAQRDGMQTKSQKGQPRSNSSKPRGKERAKLPMERWHCEGWLSITVVHPDDTPNTSYARVHLRHCLAHKHYVDVSMPDHAKELVHEMQSSTPSKIFRELLRRDPTTVVTQKQVYAYWSTVTKNKWQLDDDQVTSAHKLLEHWDGEQVQIIPVPDEDGVSAIAFAFSEMVARLNTGVVEIGLDSTFKTNSAGYELYGILTEVNGQLMPLVTILITTTEAAARNAKERVLEVALRWLHERCPNTRFTLSDKDPSEINACGTVISDGKHQLCSSRSSSPEEPEQPPVPVDENDNGNVFLASPERSRLREGMDTVYAVLSQAQGVHPRLHQRVQPAVKRLLDFSDSVQSAKRARTSKRTFTDTNKDTLYLD